MRKLLTLGVLMLMSIPSMAQVDPDDMGIFEYMRYKRSVANSQDSSVVVNAFKESVNRTPGFYLMRSATFKNAAAGCALASGVSFGVSAAFTDDDKKNARTACFVAGGVGGLASIVCYFLSARELNRAGKALELIQAKNGIGLAFKF